MTATKEELHALSARIDHLFDLGRGVEAEPLLRHALEISALDEAYSLFFRAEAAWYLERNAKKQRELVLRAYGINRGDPFIVRSAGVWYLVNSAERKARKFFDEALSLSPNDHEAARNKGLCYSNQGSEKRAMEWYVKAIAINPSDSDAMRQFGVSLSKLGKDLEAVEWYRKCLAVNPEDYDALRQLGISLAMLGNYDLSMQYLNLALAINPNDRETRINIRLVTKKMNREGETSVDRMLAHVGRKLTSWWRLVLNFIRS